MSTLHMVDTWIKNCSRLKPLLLHPGYGLRALARTQYNRYIITVMTTRNSTVMMPPALRKSATR